MKKHNIIITVLFVAYICVFAILTAALPKRDISVNEKRVLADFPQFSFEKLFSGKWERDFEDYIKDRFPMRESFAGADAYFMLLTGRNGNSGVYKGNDGCLFTTPTEKNDQILSANLDAADTFAHESGIKTKMLVVPSAGYTESDKLPKNHREYKDGEIISDIKTQLQNIEVIDPTDDFIKYRDMGEYYYKTDHHWTSEGAYLAYRLWCAGEGIEPREREDYTIKATDGFYGTLYSKSALWLTKPDKIEMWQYDADITVTIDKESEYGTMFFENRLTELDKYPVYLDGNHAFVSMVNHANPNGKKILLIKDSYAHCFAPFLAENCSQIDMVDLRYYPSPVSDLTHSTGYDEILILYGVSNLCETRDLSILS